MHLPCGDSCGHEAARVGVIVEALELGFKPVRNGRAGAGGEILCQLEVLHGEDSRHDRNGDACRAHAVEIAIVEIVVEEELGDCAGRAGIDLGFQRIYIRINAGAFRMLLRIGRHADFHVRVITLDARNEIGGLMIAIRMRSVLRADAAGGIAAQRDDVADADIVIARDHIVNVGLRCGHTGEVRGRGQLGLAENARDGRMRALTSRSTRSVSHRHEVRCQRREPVDHLPQAALHLLRLRRKELERNRRTLLSVRFGRGGCVARHASWLQISGARRGRCRSARPRSGCLQSALWAGVRHHFAFTGKISDIRRFGQPIGGNLAMGNCPLSEISRIGTGRKQGGHGQFSPIIAEFS